ncbi:hypothetical protein CTRI78_v012124 [Colletotrichum trifolii]|uniref:Uncharacterized protein n=1 Tax=Colletotrichum trifolii TaxID=5466 RepID=A0A4R8PR81_COLTR|nr:hypothetical protein CTRI78_v012124 [Colletotrichum trifolii]
MIDAITKMLQNPMNSTNKILSNCKAYRKMMSIVRAGDETKKIPEAIIWAMAIRQVALADVPGQFGKTECILAEEKYADMASVKNFLIGLIEAISGLGKNRSTPFDSFMNSLYAMDLSKLIIQSPRAKEKGVENIKIERQRRQQSTPIPEAVISEGGSDIEGNHEDNPAPLTISDEDKATLERILGQKKASECIPADDAQISEIDKLDREIRALEEKRQKIREESRLCEEHKVAMEVNEHPKAKTVTFETISCDSDDDDGHPTASSDDEDEQPAASLDKGKQRQSFSIDETGESSSSKHIAAGALTNRQKMDAWSRIDQALKDVPEPCKLQWYLDAIVNLFFDRGDDISYSIADAVLARSKSHKEARIPKLSG